jgi:glycosyltransferase involved in cell wall biosynthesis
MISKILFAIERHLYKRSDKVIFLFEKAHEYAYQKGLQPGKNMYIPNGFHQGADIDKKAFDLIKTIIAPLNDKKICAYVGSMGEANHLFPLIELAEAMKDEKNYHFIFVGNGPFKPELIGIAEEKRLNNVSFHDPVPKTSVPLLLSHCDYGLISMKDSPLYKWGFSMNKIYDYLSAGLPILMYTNMEDIGILGESDAIIKSNSIHELKKQLIQNQHFDPRAIRKFAEKHYSWEILAQKLLSEADKDVNHKDEMMSV